PLAPTQLRTTERSSGPNAQREEHLSLTHPQLKMSWWEETWRRGYIHHQYVSGQVWMCLLSQ
ncbi:hypothetical protein NP570_25060, partial [Vibrio parahaemolyticus]|nr:hypothetical protein [Vibrio parahaemolyticus]